MVLGGVLIHDGRDLGCRWQGFFFFGLEIWVWLWSRMLGFLFLFEGKLIIFNVRVSCLLNKK
jgi:hypothetical protein